METERDRVKVGGGGQRKKRGDETGNSHILLCLTQPGLEKFCRRMRKVTQAPATCPRVGIKCMLSQWRLPGMPVARCSLMSSSSWKYSSGLPSPLSQHDNCSSYDRVSEELAVKADSAPINGKLSLSVLRQVLICTAELLWTNNVVSLLVKLCY